MTDTGITPTPPPERKPAFTLTDDNRPFLPVGDFVKVEAKTESGHNRPEGYGYISETFGVGAAAFYTVKYTPAYDGGRTHKKVHLIDLTSSSPFNDCLPPESKRKRVNSGTHEP